MRKRSICFFLAAAFFSLVYGPAAFRTGKILRVEFANLKGALQQDLAYIKLRGAHLVRTGPIEGHDVDGRYVFALATKAHAARSERENRYRPEGELLTTVSLRAKDFKAPGKLEAWSTRVQDLGPLSSSVWLKIGDAREDERAHARQAFQAGSLMHQHLRATRKPFSKETGIGGLVLGALFLFLGFKTRRDKTAKETAKKRFSFSLPEFSLDSIPAGVWKVLIFIGIAIASFASKAGDNVARGVKTVSRHAGKFVDEHGADVLSTALSNAGNLKTLYDARDVLMSKTPRKLTGGQHVMGGVEEFGALQRYVREADGAFHQVSRQSRYRVAVEQNGELVRKVEENVEAAPERDEGEDTRLTLEMGLSGKVFATWKHRVRIKRLFARDRLVDYEARVEFVFRKGNWLDYVAGRAAVMRTTTAGRQALARMDEEVLEKYVVPEVASGYLKGPTDRAAKVLEQPDLELEVRGSQLSLRALGPWRARFALIPRQERSEHQRRQERKVPARSLASSESRASEKKDAVKPWQPALNPSWWKAGKGQTGLPGSSSALVLGGQEKGGAKSAVPWSRLAWNKALNNQNRALTNQKRIGSLPLGSKSLLQTALWSPVEPLAPGAWQEEGLPWKTWATKHLFPSVRLRSVRLKKLSFYAHTGKDIRLLEGTPEDGRGAFYALVVIPRGTPHVLRGDHPAFTRFNQNVGLALKTEDDVRDYVRFRLSLLGFTVLEPDSAFLPIWSRSRFAKMGITRKRGGRFEVTAHVSENGMAYQRTYAVSANGDVGETNGVFVSPSGVSAPAYEKDGRRALPVSAGLPK